MTDYQQQAKNAYMERIRQAVTSSADYPNFWDRAAAALRYQWQEAAHEGHGRRYASLDEDGKKYWRDTAGGFIEWIAEQLGDTVLTATPEALQDDERNLLAAVKKPEPKKPQVLLSHTFLKALAEAGIIDNLDMTSDVTIEARHGDYVQIHQGLIGDDRLLSITNALAAAKVVRHEG